MSRFTFGLLLGAGAGWAVGSGKAAEWKRTLDDRRNSGSGGVRSSTVSSTAFAPPVSDLGNGGLPQPTTPEGVAAL